MGCSQETFSRWVSAGGALSLFLALLLYALIFHRLPFLGDRELWIWNLAFSIHSIHSILLLILGLLPPQKKRPWIVLCYSVGILFFAGGLYLRVAKIPFPSWVVPFGGSLLLVGHLLLAGSFFFPRRG